MKTKTSMMVAAALALAATQAMAEGQGSGSAGSDTGSGARQQAGAATDAAPAGDTDATRERRGEQAAAPQQAPSVTGTEGAGGKRPHPQAQGADGERRFGEGPAQPSGFAGRPAEQTEVSGRVALVNAADHELAIDAGDTTTQVRVAPDAEITVDGKRGSLADIRQGAQVRASLEPGEDGAQAKRLEVTSSAKE